MEMLSVGVKQIGDGIFQIIGTANLDIDITQNLLIEKVAEFAEKAERNHGIPQQEMVAHTMPANVVVHATYMFLSGADIEAFLDECRDM